MPRSDRRTVVLAGLAALGFAPGGYAQTANPRKPIYPDTKNTVGESLEEIQEKGRIKIAVYEDFRPFAFVDGDRLVGIDVEIAKVIAEKLGLRLELMAVPADENVDADLRNHIWRGPRIGARSEGSIAVDAVANLMLHIPYNRELDTRNELAVLFSPYFEDRVTIARDPEQFEGGDGLRKRGEVERARGREQQQTHGDRPTHPEAHFLSRSYRFDPWVTSAASAATR